jgi:hypothetical protein
MLLVCAAHIDDHFAATSPLLQTAFITITRIATPTFLLLSGFVIGYLLRTSRGKVRLSLVDRALFLLLVAHWALGMHHIPEAGFAAWLLERVSIVDAIAVAMLCGVLLWQRRPIVLAGLGAGLCVVSWALATTLSPQSEATQIAAALLFERQFTDHRMLDIALVPYVGVFLIGMSVSGHLHDDLGARRDGAIARKLIAMGAAALALVVLGIVAWKIGERLWPSELWASDSAALWRDTLDPRVKRPPSPAYLLFYGGAGLLLLAAFFIRWPVWLFGTITQPLRLIGQASLAAFIAQDWLVYIVPAMLGFADVTSVPFWLAYLAFCGYALYRLARFWRQRNGNRYFTIGLKNRAKRRRRAPALQIAGAEPRRPEWRCRDDGWIVPASGGHPEPARQMPRTAQG